MNFSRILMAGAAAWLLSMPATPADPPVSRRPLLVFAATSLTDVLGELSKDFERQAGMPVKVSFAASSVLARQIEAGGAAEVFVAADQEWMDYLQQRSLIETPTRRDIVGNRLVLIAPADSRMELKIARGFALAAALAGGRLATAEPESVPAGRYARAALASLGLWDQMQHRLVRAESERGALLFVARGEAPLGIVYATDARAEPKVRIVDTFPEETHAPITYPGATTSGARPEAVAYLDYLCSSRARETWTRYGFLRLEK
jgi:molybdate transport system substrate-binding protein